MVQTYIIPATQEAKVGVSQVQSQLGSLSKTMPQNKIKRSGVVAQWKRACLVHV